jgi:putative addiction module CopG family antidote
MIEPRTYTPGPEADAIIEQQLAKGHYSDADEVVRIGLELLQQSEAELEELRRLIDEDEATADVLAAYMSPPRP